MRVVVTGATGNIGTSALEALRRTPSVDVVGVARRVPDTSDGVEWRAADLTTDDLAPLVRGADAVVHLAWQLASDRSFERGWQRTVGATQRLFDACVRAGVPHVVHASSVAAYSPSPDEEPVDESWETHGIASCSYSVQKAYAERLCDSLPMAVSRVRPAMVVKATAAGAVHRNWLGPFVPERLLAPGRLPVLPVLPGMRLQAVESDDVGTAIARIVEGTVPGAFNLASDPVLHGSDLAEIERARAVPVPIALAKAVVGVTWRLHAQPTEPGWLDLMLRAPVVSTERARRELGWRPRHSAVEAVAGLVRGFGQRSREETPALRDSV